MDSNFSGVLRFGGKFLAALLITALPYAIHMAPRDDTFFDSTLTFAAAFAVAGLAAGIGCGFVAVPACLVSSFLAIKWLEFTGFLGRGGDGDLFYLLALLATAVAFVAAIVGAMLRLSGKPQSWVAKLRRSLDAPKNRNEDVS